MINYNITSPDFSNDIFGIEKQMYNALTERLKSIVENALQPIANEISQYQVNVDINHNTGKMDINSPNLPPVLAEKAQSLLSEAGNRLTS